MRFTFFLPAVALAATASTVVSVLANAAPPSGSSTAAPAATSQSPQVANSGVTQMSEPTQPKPRTTGAGDKLPIVRIRKGVQASSSSIKTAVKILLDALNSVRTARSLPALSLDRRESKCSRWHSQHMALNGQISHDQFPSDVCVPYRYAAENVGFDPGSAPNAVIVLHDLMMREGPCARASCTGATYEQHAHYLNIINPLYRRVGIGIVVRRGATWLTEDFTT